MKKILKFRIVSILSGLSFILVSSSWAWAYLTLRRISQPLIIHFNNIVGIDRVGGLEDVAAIGFLGTIGIAINFLIALELEEHDRFWGKLLAVATFFFSILIFLCFATIISVNSF